MKRTKIVAFIILILLVGVIAAIGIFFSGNKDFSFQDLKREEIKEIAFNTRDDFYYALSEEDTNVIYEKLQEINLEDSGADDVALQNGVKMRLTLKNGEEISFQGSGHTFVMENKAYYIDGDAIDVIDNLCYTRWEALQEENEKRTDFFDLKEETVRDIRVCEGIGLCYKLSKEEKCDILTFLNSMEIKNGQEAAADSAKKRYQIEKEDGIVVEFSVDESGLFMNGKVFSISEEDGEALREKQEKWLEKVCEETRQTPFSNFNEETIKSIALANPSWADTRELTEEAKKELLDLLCQLSVVGEGTEDYIGREGLITEAFLIEKEDGSKISMSANRDPFIIDGKGYVIENEELAEQLADMYQKLVAQE